MHGALRELCDPPDLRLHPSSQHDRRRVPAGAVRSAEDEIRSLQARAGCGRAVRSAVDRKRLARERRGVDLERAREQARVGRDGIALAYDDDVARHEDPRLDLAALPITHDHRVLWEIAAECLHGLACLLLLGERERGVECDDDDDGDRDDRAARDEREGSGTPEQEGERMRQLARKRAGPRCPAALHELVRPGGEQAARGLEARQTRVGIDLWRVGGSRSGRCGHAAFLSLNAVRAVHARWAAEGKGGS